MNTADQIQAHLHEVERVAMDKLREEFNRLRQLNRDSEVILDESPNAIAANALVNAAWVVDERATMSRILIDAPGIRSRLTGVSAR